MRFPFLDLQTQYQELKTELDAAVLKVMESARFIMGPEVDAFEQEMAAFCGTAHAVGVDSGTRALELIYRALDLQPGDEVVTTPFTFAATVSSIVEGGGKPVFADILPGTFNIDPAAVQRAISKRTRAITPVHLFGLPVDMENLAQIAGDIPLIEDACQAVGATRGGRKACSAGRAAALSFFPSKNLGGAGDGGMVLTNDEQLARLVRIYRNHGSEKRYHHSHVGCTGRLDALQAAVLRVKLPHLKRWNKERQARADRYREALKDVVAVQEVPPGATHVYHQFTLRTEQRDELLAFLQKQEIPAVIYYPNPLHLQEAYAFLGYKQGDFPVAEKTAQQVLSLPMGPCLKPENQETVINAVREFFGVG